MKKLLFLGSPFEYRQGGSEYQYKILEQNLKRKYAIYYIFRHPTSKREKNYITYDYRFRRSYKEGLYTDALVIYRLIKSLSPEIIYKRGINYIAALGTHYARAQDICMVLHISSQRDVEEPKNKRGIKAIFGFFNHNIAKYAIKNANKVICQAQYQNKLLQANYGRSCDLILPNMQPIPENNIKKTTPTQIVWISNFKPLKQPELFIALAESFCESHNAKFIMIGRPATGAWKKKLLEKINRLPNLEYRGELSIEQVNKVLNESHMLVNTSEYEGFPNTYIQAWMRKVPVVALNSDPDDIIETNGIGFHSKTYRQMMADVKTLIENQQLREQIGENSYRFARSYFSVANIDNFIQLVENR